MKTRLFVTFPLIIEFTNSDTMDNIYGSFQTVFNRRIKQYHLGEVLGDELMLLYVKKLPTDKELFQLLRKFNKFENDAEIKYFMQEATIEGFKD